MSKQKPICVHILINYGLVDAKIRTSDKDLPVQQTNDSLPEQAEEKNQIRSKSNYSKTFCAEFFFIFLASV